MLQTQDLRVDQEKESCIRVNTRELDRVPSTMYLPYILIADSLYSTNLAYPK